MGRLPLTRVFLSFRAYKSQTRLHTSYPQTHASQFVSTDHVKNQKNSVFLVGSQRSLAHIPTTKIVYQNFSNWEIQNAYD